MIDSWFSCPIEAEINNAIVLVQTLITSEETEKLNFLVRHIWPLTCFALNFECPFLDSIVNITIIIFFMNELKI